MKKEKSEGRVLDVKTISDGKAEVYVLPCKIIDLAKFYRVSYKTVSRWVKEMEKEIGKPKGHFLTVTQVTAILQEFGMPKKVIIE